MGALLDDDDSYSENSHERANENNALMYSSVSRDEMTRQRVRRYGVHGAGLVRSTLTALQRLHNCVDRNGPSSWVER